ncbi:T-complex protein 1, delta subunit, putative [Entamoeba histolytica HM-1:IMSS-B]|uniref:T-complex protein 1 subunit delta n=5 Tax=Entamoeba histolytica TaxID=5759 RepID=C4M419_ENTH1|nr:chaperonin containing TCP-1 delta subunit, putative [Entamoeba histolytica HM-1:IMSS]EMD46185.1 chaperonin -containing TCP1 delta subunit, putative [Entamoeba histolytica KU27]EMH72341.1 T-complex protein 1, delta subunit, putative [Entamoeba histolytica HM-1:IMSS-B]EMS17060.1 chaperonin containing TCP-1 delta subunit [Entamoeba histolytica HM-3:IMSS]GAT96091.1 chaperonin containing tcp 1 delta subunit putative [Entamoeba histolytica]EAL46389.1 chaperonin containing TCP-1 delta subunit, put|eukprot:XP_651775.1 chaperonin containing TCP-1 delta subunit, putative [Entamoeba histolytica HM-1:IMSS]
MSTTTAPKQHQKGEMKEGKEGEKNIRQTNIIAAKSVADAVRTSLGPRGMDKMIISPNGETIITNDGATIIQQLKLQHPCALMMSELSKSQDIEAGDGTTTVTILAGAMLSAANILLNKGVNPSVIARAFHLSSAKSAEILKEASIPIELTDRESLLKAANTSLNSKVVNQSSQTFAPIAVDSVMKVIDINTATNVDLRNIRITKKIGGTIDDTELIDGLVFLQKASHVSGGPTHIENAKIGVCQFCISPPKTNMDGNVVITDYAQMDKVLKEERAYTLKLCRAIQKSGCNVLLIQKSILREGVSDLALHFLAKLKIMVVKDIERDDIEFICKTIEAVPIASIDGFTEDKLGHAENVEEVSIEDEDKIVKITGVKGTAPCVSVLVRGANRLVLDEAERSLHDALCVVRSLVKCKYLCPGGGAMEMELCCKLKQWAETLKGEYGLCVKEYAEAFEIIPYTLAENAGLNPMELVTQLKLAHLNGEKNAGISMRKDNKVQGSVDDMTSLNVVNPLLVFLSAVKLATDTVALILKIDNIVVAR